MGRLMKYKDLDVDLSKVTEDRITVKVTIFRYEVAKSSMLYFNTRSVICDSTFSLSGCLSPIVSIVSIR